MVGAHLTPSTATLTPSGVDTRSRACTHGWLTALLFWCSVLQEAESKKAHFQAKRLQSLVRGDVGRCLGRLGSSHSLCAGEACSGTGDVLRHLYLWLVSCAYTFFGAMQTQVAVAARLTGVVGELIAVRQSFSFPSGSAVVGRHRSLWVKAGCSKTAPSPDALDAWGLRQFEMQNSRGCDTPLAAPAAQGRASYKFWSYSQGHA